MTVYSSDVTAASRTLRDGLSAIAAAIEKSASKPNYIVNVIVTDATSPETIAAKVQEALDRVEKRERARG